MTPVDELLFEIAASVEDALAANVETRNMVETLLAQGQNPHFVRLLDCLNGAEAVICIRKSEPSEGSHA
jgi:hypothetical protein